METFPPVSGAVHKDMEIFETSNELIALPFVMGNPAPRKPRLNNPVSSIKINGRSIYRSAESVRSSHIHKRIAIQGI
jgi:hypothetical protein